MALKMSKPSGPHVCLIRVVRSFELAQERERAGVTGCIGCIGGLTVGGGFSTAGASSGWSPILFYGVGWVKAAVTM